MNTDLIIICITFLIAFFLHTKLVATALEKNTRVFSENETPENIEVSANDLSEGSTSTEQAETNPPKKEELLDFDNLNSASDDAILKGLAQIESRQEKPKMMSIVERKQLLTYHAKKRNLLVD